MMFQEFNLVAAERLRAHRIHRWLRSGILIACTLSLLLGGWVVLASQKLNDLQRQEAQLRQEKGVPQNITKQVSKAEMERQRNQIQFANRLIAVDSFSWGALFQALEETLSDGISLRSIQPDPKQKTVKLEGEALSIAHLRTYIQRLLASKSFSDTDLLSHQMQQDPKRHKKPFVRFSLTVKQAF